MLFLRCIGVTLCACDYAKRCVSNDLYVMYTCLISVIQKSFGADHETSSERARGEERILVNDGADVERKVSNSYRRLCGMSSLRMMVVWRPSIV